MCVSDYLLTHSAFVFRSLALPGRMDSVRDRAGTQGLHGIGLFRPGAQGTGRLSDLDKDHRPLVKFKEYEVAVLGGMCAGIEGYDMEHHLPLVLGFRNFI